MNPRHLLVVAILSLVCVSIFYPDWALAQFSGGGELESKIHGIQSALINFLLPAVSILGLVYSAILAASGDAGAKPRMILVIFASAVGFLAPLVIKWIQGMTH